MKMGGRRNDYDVGLPSEAGFEVSNLTHRQLIGNRFAARRVGFGEREFLEAKGLEVTQMPLPDGPAADNQSVHVDFPVFAAAYSERSSPIQMRSLYLPSWNNASRIRPSTRKPAFS